MVFFFSLSYMNYVIHINSKLSPKALLKMEQCSSLFVFLLLNLILIMYHDPLNNN